jgi:hypothetical protein
VKDQAGPECEAKIKLWWQKLKEIEALQPDGSIHYGYCQTLANEFGVSYAFAEWLAKLPAPPS